MSTKKDSSCLFNAKDDEEIFVLLARDAKSPEVIVEWIKQSIRTQTPDKLRSALEVAIKMAKPLNGSLPLYLSMDERFPVSDEHGH